MAKPGLHSVFVFCCFLGWPWSFKITHVSRHFSWKFKHGAGNREGIDLSTNRNMHIYIYIYLSILNAQQGMVFVGSRHFTTCLWFMPIFTICHVYAVKRPLRVLFHPQQRCGITREKSKHRTWQSPVCTVCLFFQNHVKITLKSLFGGFFQENIIWKLFCSIFATKINLKSLQNHFQITFWMTFPGKSPLEAVLLHFCN